MNKETRSKIRELLADEMLEKVTGGVGPDSIYPEPDVEEVKKMTLMIYEMLGRQVTIDYAKALLGCTTEEVESWLPD